MDEITQKQLDRLKRLDEKNRNRVKKFKDKARAAGYRQLTVMLDGMTYNELCRRRDRSIQDDNPLSLADVIKQALFQGNQDNVTAIISDNIKPESKEPEYSLFDYLEDAKATDTPEPEPMVKSAPVVDQGDIKTAPEPKADNMEFDSRLLAIDAEGGTWAEKAERAKVKGILSKREKPLTANNLRMAIASIKKRQGKP